MSEKPKVLIAEPQTQITNRLVDFLAQRGFLCRQTSSASHLKLLMEEWQPQFVIYDMMLPELNCFTFLDQIKKGQIKAAEETSILITSNNKRSDNIRRCILMGASDFILRPYKFEDLLSRMVLHSQKKEDLAEVEEATLDDSADQQSEYYLHLTELLLRNTLQPISSSQNPPLYDWLKMLEHALKSVRCSLIQTNAESMKGTVWSSSDDVNFKGFELDLYKYPEIQAVLSTQKMFAIEDLENSNKLAHIKESFKDIKFNAMIVCPVWVDQELWGVVSSRLPDSNPPLHDHSLRLAQIFAHVIGLSLSNPTATHSYSEKKEAS